MGSSQTRDQTCVPCIGREILNHWTTKEVPGSYFKGVMCQLSHEGQDLARRGAGAGWDGVRGGDLGAPLETKKTRDAKRSKPGEKCLR